MTIDGPAQTPKGRRHVPRWLTSRRHRVLAGLLAVVLTLVVVFVTDPFASPPSPSGVSDNAYPTATATVTQQTLSNQTQVSATLGYAGTYTVAVPSGTSAAAIAQAQSTLQMYEAKVAGDRTTLKNAQATAQPTEASTLLAARSAVLTDETALTQARAQLASDESLACPASSDITVTSPVGGSAASNNTSANLRVPTTSPVDPTSHAPLPQTPNPASAPSVMTGPADSIHSTSATLTGTVNPNGADTTYYFEYGTSPNYGEVTSSTDAGAGADPVSVTYPLASLAPGESYHYRLVATNTQGVTFGQDGTFETSAAPSVTTGSASAVSSTSESLSGTVNPNGADTTYYFEYGASASFGSTSPVTEAGGDVSPVSVAATITGLTPGATYDYALAASSSLGSATGVTLTFQAAASSCVSQRAVIAGDTQALAQARDALTLDELGQGSQARAADATLVTDEATAAIDQKALEADQSNATNANTTFTQLPRVGARLQRGESVYELNDEPVPLLYGPVPLYRALYLGVSSGPDVTELNRNLIALGFEGGSASDSFTSSTASAVASWQSSLNEPATGVIALGDVVIEPGPLDVASVSASLGQVASGGMSILTATSDTPVVIIDLDASQQSEVKVGDPVTITLPNNATTPGVISSVGTVATNPPAGSQDATPTITVIVTPTKLSGVGHFDQAPVNVSITNATVTNVFTVPVDALLALANGGYAVEEIAANAEHHLVAVTLGLFDDAEGKVQVSGSGLAAGQRVVVPKL